MRAWRLLTGVQRSLGHLRTVSDLPALYERGIRLLCEVCGFDRAFFARVDGSLMRIEYVHFPGDPELAAAFRALAATDPPKLDHLLLETEMIRRRAPLLVTDAANDPRTHQALTKLGMSRSYVAAPILPAGKVVGFLHADRYDSGQNVDELDRDGLFAFAEGFGYAIERVRLRERLRAQRDQVLTLVHQTEELFADLSDEDPALTEAAPGSGRPTGGIGTPIASPPRTGIAELADPPRARGAAASGRREHQRADRRRPGDLADDRQVARPEHPAQAAGQQSRRGGLPLPARRAALTGRAGAPRPPDQRRDGGSGCRSG